jgi:hypothetical protein
MPFYSILPALLTFKDQQVAVSLTKYFNGQPLVLVAALVRSRSHWVSTVQ